MGIVVQERIGNIKLDTLDTPEKLCPMADEIIPVLAAVLRDTARLMEEMTARDNKLDESRPGGRYSCIVHPDTPALWQEYRERYHALFDPHCTKKFLERRIDCCQSMGKPEFSTLDVDGVRVSFQMKSRNKAVIVVCAEDHSPQNDHRFVMRLEEDIWKIDEIAFRFYQDPKWHVDRYV